MKSIARDVIGLIGVGLVSYGAWLILPGAGFIVGGTLLVIGVILNSRSAK